MDELSKSIIASSLNPIISWFIPVFFGGLIFVVKFPFSAIKRTKDEYIKIITAYMAAGQIPSKDDLIDLKHMLARKHHISANDFPTMEITLDYCYCNYWASESIDIDQKNSFNTYFLSNKAAFIQNDSIISKTYTDHCRKFLFDIILNFLYAVIVIFISLIFVTALKSIPTSYSTFFLNIGMFFLFICFGQLVPFLLQKLFKLIVFIYTIIKNKCHFI